MNVRCRYCAGVWARSHTVSFLESSFQVEGVRHTTMLSMWHTSGISEKRMEPYREVVKEGSGCKPEYQQRTGLGNWKMIPRKSRIESPRKSDTFLPPFGTFSGHC